MVKNLPSKAGDLRSIPGPGRPPGEKNDNPFQYPCLENSMVRGAWRATVHRVAKSWTWLTNPGAERAESPKRPQDQNKEAVTGVCMVCTTGCQMRMQVSMGIDYDNWGPDVLLPSSPVPAGGFDSIYFPLKTMEGVGERPWLSWDPTELTKIKFQSFGRKGTCRDK